jgi:predicted nucleic acid-binding protein
LLVSRLNPDAAEHFIASATRGAFQIFDYRLTHLPSVTEFMRKYRDLPMDLADASLVVLAEHLGHGRILSTDRRDLRTYRWKNRKPFHNSLVVDRSA